MGSEFYNPMAGNPATGMFGEELGGSTDPVVFYNGGPIDGQQTTVATWTGRPSRQDVIEETSDTADNVASVLK